MDSTTDGNLAVRGSTTDPYPTPAGSAPFTSLTCPESMRAARATAQMFDAIAAPLTRAIDQAERELGIVREDKAREQAIVDEAEPKTADAFEHCAEFAETASITRDRVEIFHDELTIGLLNEFERDLEMDGFHPSGIGIRRNARGGIVGMVILLGPAEAREGGR